MTRTSLLILALGLLFFISGSCRQPTADVVQPKPTVPAPTINLLKEDPASLMAGVYTGDIFTRIETRMGLLGPATHLLVRRLGTHRVQFFSVYGQMNTYTVDLTVNGDTIKHAPDQPLDVSMVMRANKPIDFHVMGTRKLTFAGSQPDMVFFNWLNYTEFRPLSPYLSTDVGQASLSFITGVYCGDIPVRVNDERKFYFTAKPLVVRQVSNNEIEIFDINRWQVPIRFSFQKNAEDSTWTGQNNTMKIAITVKGGRPQRFIIQPKTADTTSAYAGWPPLNYAWDTQKKNYNHSYIPL